MAISLSLLPYIMPSGKVWKPEKLWDYADSWVHRVGFTWGMKDASNPIREVCVYLKFEMESPKVNKHEPEYAPDFW